MECDSKYLKGCKKKLIKIKRIPKPKKENEVFEKKLKCPKGFKVCKCNPKKPKCKRSNTDSKNHKKIKRDYKKEYKDFQGKKKQIKYRSELNKYNRKNGAVKGDKMDASHDKNGKIKGYEKQSTNRKRNYKTY